jgi:small-conductance mechanosensitive channel
MISNDNRQDLEYLLSAVGKLFIFLERPQVQIQLFAIAGIIIVSTVAYHFIWLKIKKNFPYLLIFWSIDKPIRDQRYGFILISYLTLPILTILGIYLILKFWQSQDLMDGLIKLGLEIAFLHLGYRIFFASLFLLFSPIIVRKYQLSFGLPIFTLIVFSKIISLTENLQDLLTVNILTLFGSPISLGGIILSSIGLYLWCVGVGIFQYLLLPIMTLGNRLDKGSAQATLLLIRYFLIALGIVLIFGYVGFNPTTFAAITGGLSVGLGFGLKEVFSNFISGICLLFEGVLRPGDLISIDGNTAEIKKLGIRATTVTVIKDNSEKIIPNQTFFTDIFTTFTGSDRIIRNSLTIGASYDANPQKVIEILLTLADEHIHILKDPNPSAFLIEFADSSINYELTFYLDDPTIGKTVKSDLSRQLWQQFAENGIEIPFPQRDIHIRSHVNSNPSSPSDKN